jgi:hypothetical protein
MSHCILGRSISSFYLEMVCFGTKIYARRKARSEGLVFMHDRYDA